MDEAFFLSADSRLRPANAVAALIVLEGCRYVMQLRDASPGIFYPEHWGCFGGAVDIGEKPLQALRRELFEELEFELVDASEFTRFDFDLTNLGHGRVYRIYYEVPVSLDAYSRVVLHEGAAVKAFAGAEILNEPRVTPYDAFAVWLHLKRARFE